MSLFIRILFPQGTEDLQTAEKQERVCIQSTLMLAAGEQTRTQNVKIIRTVDIHFMIQQH